MDQGSGNVKNGYFISRRQLMKLAAWGTSMFSSWAKAFAMPGLKGVRQEIIAIDFGAAYSRVAVMQGSAQTIISSSTGFRNIPSTVAFTKDGKQLAGDPVKMSGASQFGDIFPNIKRLMGSRLDDPVVKKYQDLVPYQIISVGDGDAGIISNGQTYSPAQIAAITLQALKEAAEAHLGEKVGHAVVTVPSWFNTLQRQAVEEAGKLAGLEVMRLVNEPSAVALAYSYGRAKHGNIVVYKLGGGSFDVSIVSLAGGVCEVKSCGGDALLGGEDFDMCLVEYIAKELRTKHSIDLRRDKVLLQKLKSAAEKAKIELSSVDETEVSVSIPAAKKSAPRQLTVKLTRVLLETLVDGLVQKTLGYCELALRDAGLKAADISEAVLAGGMTRMPKIRQAVTTFFGRAPGEETNPDESAVIGAAIQAGILQGDARDVLFLDVLSQSVGFEAPGGVFTRVIKRNTTIPTQKTQRFTTADIFQRAIKVGAFQGEDQMAARNRRLGQLECEVGPGMLNTIAVTVHVDTSGIVSVSAIDQTTHLDIPIHIRTSGGLITQRD